ncbi:MAG: NAD-dependent epimerase/dehydratase family protein [Candidatus Thermoplasmatota archaeon]|nr:NAD-dependent epimerase/dehydratase family protein [Candidatus Thermoplasmatota archaeon]
MVMERLGTASGYRNILIAGGAGFIGSNLAGYLLEQEGVERIMVIDNFVSGSRRNIEGLANDRRLSLLEMDITDPSVVEKAGRGFDLVLHLASIANPTDYETCPVETLLVNSDGSRNVIDIAGRSKARYVFFSSSEVYGNYDPIPYNNLSESLPGRIVLNQKRSPYVVGKCFGEEMAINLCARKGLKHLIIRPFNIYGPNMDLMTNYGRVIPNFCIWGLRGMPLRIHGDGRQVRSFCHIDDLVNALALLLKKDITGMSINIGYPDPTSILDLAGMVSKILGLPENFQFVERYPYEPAIRIPDITLIGNLTGWKPEVDLRSGLEDMIGWFRKIGMRKYDRITRSDG